MKEKAEVSPAALGNAGAVQLGGEGDQGWAHALIRLLTATRWTYICHFDDSADTVTACV